MNLEELYFGLQTKMIDTIFDVDLELVGDRESEFLREYNRLSVASEGNIEKWLMLHKGRDYDGDELILELLSEIYKKLEILEQKIDGRNNIFLPLQTRAITHSIGHGAICFQNPILEQDKRYYARFMLPIFPSRMVCVFLEALNSYVAKIVIMGARDIRDFDSYVAERERIIIREKKGL